MSVDLTFQHLWLFPVRAGFNMCANLGLLSHFAGLVFSQKFLFFFFLFVLFVLFCVFETESLHAAWLA